MLEVGNFVQVISNIEDFSRHIGVVVGDDDNGLMRVLWLTAGCHLTVHWRPDSLRKVEGPPDEIAWSEVAGKVGTYIESLLHFTHRGE